MDAALIASTALLGLAGSPHCAAMCGAPCALAVGRGGWPAMAAFQVARALSYAAVGALAAGSVSALAEWGQVVPALRPLWTLLHVAALALGLWLLWQGRQPAWLGTLGRAPVPPADAGGTRPVTVLAAGGGHTAALGTYPVRVPPPRRGIWRAAGVGVWWAAWPCGLLQSALVVAAMANSAAAGAAAMAGFAVASAAGLWLGPWAWRRWLAGPGRHRREALWVRGGGLLLALASAWALGHGLWLRVAAWCGLT